MSRENNLIRIAAILTTAALGVHFVKQSETKPLTINSGFPTELSPIDIETTRVAPLTTPGAFERAISATAQAFSEGGWQKFVESGFPEIAITSSVKVDLWNDEFGAQGSGNIMRAEGYWVILTAAHVMDLDQPEFDLGRIKSLSLSGDKILPNWTSLNLERGKFGLANSRAEGIDFGVIVIPEENIPSPEREIFKDSVLTKEQINFGQANLDGLYYGLCFPGNRREPSVTFEGELAKFLIEPVIKSRIIVKNSLATHGCSGGGVFVREGDRVYYVGPNSGTFGPHPTFADCSIVANVGSLGEKGFDDLIEKGIENLNTGN